MASDNSSSNTDTNLSSKPVKPPEVVKFAFKEFIVDSKENKWKAKCTTCNEWFTETRGTTTGFSRYKFAIFSKMLTCSLLLIVFSSNRRSNIILNDKFLIGTPDVAYSAN